MFLQLLHTLPLTLYFFVKAALQVPLQCIFTCCCHGAGRPAAPYLQHHAAARSLHLLDVIDGSPDTQAGRGPFSRSSRSSRTLPQERFPRHWIQKVSVWKQ